MEFASYLAGSAGVTTPPARTRCSHRSPAASTTTSATPVAMRSRPGPPGHTACAGTTPSASWSRCAPRSQPCPSRAWTGSARWPSASCPAPGDRGTRRRASPGSRHWPIARSPTFRTPAAWAASGPPLHRRRGLATCTAPPPRRSPGSPTTGIAAACIDDPDALLIATLDEAIGDVEQAARRPRRASRTRAPPDRPGLPPPRGADRVESRDRTTARDHHRTAPKGAAACPERTSPASKPRSARARRRPVVRRRSRPDHRARDLPIDHDRALHGRRRASTFIDAITAKVHASR